VKDVTTKLKELASIQRIRNINDPKGQQQAMTDSLKRIEELDMIMFINLDGTAIRVSEEKSQGYSEREYFKKSKAQGVPMYLKYWFQDPQANLRLAQNRRHLIAIKLLYLLQR